LSAVPYLRLVRASIALSPIADGVAGLALAAAVGRAVESGPVACALGASLLLFLFGMSQNDWADRKKDARLGRARPIPSGEISAVVALVISLACMVGALFLAALASPAAAWLATSLVVCISLYNLAPGHGGWLGPFLLALIRAQNLALGAAALGAPRAALMPAAVYAVYVFGISAAARMEDGEVDLSVRALRGWLLVVMTAAMAAPVVVLCGTSGPLPATAWASLAIAVGLVLWIERAWRSALTAERWTGPTLPRLIGAGLSGYFLFDGSIAVAAGAPSAGAVLLLMFPISRAMVRRFPPS